MKTILKIESSKVEDSILPARVTAYRRNGTVVEAGDKFLNLATITLFSLLTGKQLSPEAIKRIIKRKRLQVDSEVLNVL